MYDLSKGKLSKHLEFDFIWVKKKGFVLQFDEVYWLEVDA